MAGWEDCLEFGARSPGLVYRDRPGAYAVIRDEAGRVAVVRLRGRYFLPGGGMEQGETPLQTLTREAREECGREIVVDDWLGSAAEYLISPVSGEPLRVVGTFYAAHWGAVLCEPEEAGCELIYLTMDEAVQKLLSAHQSWVLRQVS